VRTLYPSGYNPDYWVENLIFSLDAHGLNGGNPQFVDLVNGDYHLLSSSPLINAGIALVGFVTDRDGVTRPQGAAWDVGPYEYVASVTGPGVTVNQAAGQADPTAAAPVVFTATFTAPVTGFATGDVLVAGSAGPTTATVTGSGATYSIAVTGMTTSGTVIVTIPAGVCVDGAGHSNFSSTSTDNLVNYISGVPPAPTFISATLQ
jgi:hypothetical protein